MCSFSMAMFNNVSATTNINNKIMYITRHGTNRVSPKTVTFLTVHTQGKITAPSCPVPACFVLSNMMFFLGVYVDIPPDR